MPVNTANNLKKITTDLIDAFNAHDVDRAASFFSTEYHGVDVSQASPHSGREGIRKNLSLYIEAFPDFQIKADETITNGNRIVVIWSSKATHQGKLMNIPPTGRKIESRGVTVLTVENNQVKRGLYFWDVAGVLREMGLLPEL